MDGARHAINNLLLNARPNNPLLKSAVAIFSYVFACYTAIQMKNSTRNASAITRENIGDKHNSCQLPQSQGAILCYHELTPCVVSEKNWDKKDNKGKSMILVLYVLQFETRCVLGAK